MNTDLILFLYGILISVFIMFIFISLFYLFNQKVLSKFNLSFKISIYISLLTFALMVVEFLIIDYYDVNIMEARNQYFLLSISFIIYIFLVFLTLYINLYPIKKIEKNTRLLSRGKDNKNVILGSKEFEKIQENLQAIEDKNDQSEEYKSKLKNEYYKFVPKEFFEYLGKNEVFELKLGESVQKEVTVLFIDIKHSFRASETLSLEENFKFINNYLSVVGECVRNNKGFIDKFLGDGVLAVFLNETDALKCSTEIAQKFENINLVSIGNEKIKYGIGIHSGKVVIGIVGEKERLTPTIISDSVNLASKIEHLNRIFLSNILFTKEVLNNIPRDFELNYRYVGTVNIDDIGVSLFENLDGYAGSNKTAYIKTKLIFESAVRKFEEKDYKEARKLFLNVLKINEDDNLSKFYLKKCKIV